MRNKVVNPNLEGKLSFWLRRQSALPFRPTLWWMRTQWRHQEFLQNLQPVNWNLLLLQTYLPWRNHASEWGVWRTVSFLNVSVTNGRTDKPILGKGWSDTFGKYQNSKQLSVYQGWEWVDKLLSFLPCEADSCIQGEYEAIWPGGIMKRAFLYIIFVFCSCCSTWKRSDIYDPERHIFCTCTASSILSTL